MAQSRRIPSFAIGLLAAGLVAQASAADTIKLGLSVPLSGAAANWGKGGEWLCKQAAQEIAKAGGVKVGGKTYEYECVAYDNKYNAADGTKVAQTLLSRDNVKFIGGSLGTAPVRALQSLSERDGVMLFTTAWGKAIKGPKFPLTFTQMNTVYEISKPLLGYVKQANPNIKTVALLNPNDATGQDVEAADRANWEALGVKVVSSDWYERGTTEFQPIAAKIAAIKPDAVDLGAAPPPDAGFVFKELKAQNWNGTKVVTVGSGAEGILATGQDAADGTYMGAAMTFDSAATTAKQKALNDGVKAATGESVNAIQIGFYDAVYALKAAMEKAQSVDPKQVAAALPTVTFDGFYGKSAFGGSAMYGSPQQILVPVIVSQLKGGKLAELQRIAPDELKSR